MAKKARIVGASRLRRKLKRMPEEIRLGLAAVIDEQAELVLAEMQQRAPVSEAAVPKDFEGRPREHLRDALAKSTSKDGLRTRIGLMGKRSRKVFFFARFVEFGTRFMSARAFITPTWNANVESVRKAVKGATVEALAKVSRSRPSDEPLA